MALFLASGFDVILEFLPFHFEYARLNIPVTDLSIVVKHLVQIDDLVLSFHRVVCRLYAPEALLLGS